MSLHQIFLKDGDDVAVLIATGPSVSDPCGLIGGYVRTFRVVFSRETLELVALQPLRALSTFEFDELNHRLNKATADPATNYVESLKTLPLHMLEESRAVASVTDMYKYGMINDEIKRRQVKGNQ